MAPILLALPLLVGGAIVLAVIQVAVKSALRRWKLTKPNPLGGPLGTGGRPRPVARNDLVAAAASPAETPDEVAAQVVDAILERIEADGARAAIPVPGSPHPNGGTWPTWPPPGPVPGGIPGAPMDSIRPDEPPRAGEPTMDLTEPRPWEGWVKW